MATPAEKEETRFTSRIKHTHAQAWNTHTHTHTHTSSRSEHTHKLRLGTHTQAQAWNTHTQAQAWNTAYLFVEPVLTCAPLAHDQLSHVDNQSASTS